MRFKIIFDESPHCKDVPDGRMLEEHIQKYHDRLQANTKLGFTFLVVFINCRGANSDSGSEVMHGKDCIQFELRRSNLQFTGFWSCRISA